jgi:hypothetical protein
VRNHLAISIISIFTLAGAAQASQQESPDFSNAVKSVSEKLKNAQFPEVTQQALGALVQTGVQALQANGFTNEATRFSQQWQTTYANYFTGMQSRALGDHQPLSQWLVGFYNTLLADLGPDVCNFLNLSDIYIFNYSIPVVFNPTGLNGDTWNQAEYANHFVPFAAATTYWISDLSCEAATTGLISWTCGVLANGPRYLMQNYLAAPISDYVYGQFNGSCTSPSSTIAGH